MDGLPSEVRLNWTEVNNGCLEKARSSHSGSNEKKVKNIKEEKKKQPEVFLKGSCQTPFVWACSTLCHLPQPPIKPLDFSVPCYPLKLKLECVCMCMLVWGTDRQRDREWAGVYSVSRACFKVPDRTGTDNRWRSCPCAALSAALLRCLGQHKVSFLAFPSLWKGQGEKGRFKIKLKDNDKATASGPDHARAFEGTHLGWQEEAGEQKCLAEKVNKAKIPPTKLIN